MSAGLSLSDLVAEQGPLILLSGDGGVNVDPAVIKFGGARVKITGASIIAPTSNILSGASSVDVSTVLEVGGSNASGAGNGYDTNCSFNQIESAHINLVFGGNAYSDGFENVNLGGNATVTLIGDSFPSLGVTAGLAQAIPFGAPGGSATTTINVPATSTSLLLSASVGSGMNLSIGGQTSTLFVNGPNVTTLTGTVLNLLTDGTSNSINIQCPNLVDVTGEIFGSLSDYCGMGIVNGKLSAASVNWVLSQYVSGSPSGNNTTINLSGGTNSPPAGQGITDAATLSGMGITVLTN